MACGEISGAAQESCYNPAMSKQLTTCVWESEVIRTGENTVTVRANKPMPRMSCKQAAQLLGTTAWQVQKLYRQGILSGWKPGGILIRKDGRKSNASIVLDAASVLNYKQRVSQTGVF